MRPHHALASLAVVTLAVCAPPDAEQAEPAVEPAAEMSAEAAIEQIRADYVSNYNLHQANMVADLFADSAIFWSANGAIAEGREAVQAMLEEQMAGSPTVDITTAETRIEGEAALARGSYSVTSTQEDGAEMVSSGNYITMFGLVDGAWKIGAVMTNFDAVPPEGYPLVDLPEGEVPEEGAMGDLVAAYMEHFNAGDAAGVAGLHTANANFAFSNAPLAEGTAAIQAALEERMAMGSPRIEIHDVGSGEFGAGWMIDGGWYGLRASTDAGDVEQIGTYLLLCQEQADGTWKIHWGLSNGVAKPVM